MSHRDVVGDTAAAPFGHRADQGPTGLAAVMLQQLRPTWHSGAIMLSHVLFAVAIQTAWRRRMLFEAAAMLASVVISLHYHICDENIVCPFGWSIVTWHALDVWATFFLISSVLGVMILDLAERVHRYVLRTMFTAWVTVAVWYDRSSVVNLGAILGTVFSMIAVRYVVQRHHVVVGSSPTYGSGYEPAFPSLGSSSSVVGGQSMKKRRRVFVVRRLVIGLSVFAIALACFMVANAPISDAVKTYDASRYPPGAVKPMDVPDTAVYWIVHSVWHVASAVSAYFVLRVHDWEDK